MAKYTVVFATEYSFPILFLDKLRSIFLRLYAVDAREKYLNQARCVLIVVLVFKIH